ncbi:MAG: BatD family protein, partial [Chthoniobacteraceae bacterium]
MHQLLPFRTETVSAARLRLLVLLFTTFAAIAPSVVAQDEITAKAVLSQQTARVGDVVQLQIQVEGSSRPIPKPPNFQVDGLLIRFTGHERRIEMSGFTSVKTNVSYNYQVVAERAGEFKIPAVTFVQDNQDVTTNAVTLRAQGSGRAQLGSGARRRDPNAQADPAPLGRVGWAEIIIPKETAYLGETLPVELRLFVDSTVRWAPESMPELEGEGFTKTKMPEPSQERVIRDGRQYDVLIFRTAITPSRAGKVKIGPSEIIYNASIPRAQPTRRRGSSLDDFFQDFFNDPTGRMSRTEQRKAVAEPVELEVLPLPTEGRPASFTGAVGNFAMAVEGTPKTVKLGDPVTMTIRLVGRGNFDRVNAPALSDPRGWRTYPPTSSFSPDDEVSYRGTKTFQMAVIPEERQTTMPQFEFTYFDPEARKYVALKSEPVPLNVEGTVRSAAPAQVPRSAGPATAQPPGDEPGPST